ncbi:hypothetical protein [Streptomyces sp. NPDC002078]
MHTGFTSATVSVSWSLVEVRTQSLARTKLGTTVFNDLRKFLKGIQGRPPVGHGGFRQVGVVAYDDRVCRLARRLRLAQLGDLLLVVRVDDGDMEAAAGHGALCPACHRRMLLVAPTVAHQHQGCLAGRGGGRPENAGDLAHDEVAQDHAVR